MSGSVNRVTLAGHVGIDPQVRADDAGQNVVAFSIATSEGWRVNGGAKRKECTEWQNVVLINEGRVSVAEKSLKKGSKLLPRGPAAQSQVHGAERQRPPDSYARGRGAHPVAATSMSKIPS